MKYNTNRKECIIDSNGEEHLSYLLYTHVDVKKTEDVNITAWPCLSLGKCTIPNSCSGPFWTRGIPGKIPTFSFHSLIFQCF